MTTDTVGDTSSTVADYGYLWGVPITASASGTLQSIGLNVATAAGNARVAIYSTFSNNEFSGLLWQSSDATLAAGWNDISSSGVTITQGTTYYICQENNNSNAVFYGTVESGSYYSSLTYGAFPNPTSTLSSSAHLPNMRITYSTSGGASKLAYTLGAGQSINVGQVSSEITVQVQNSSGSPVTSGANVSLSTSSGGGTFYSNSNGTGQITSLTIASGQSSASFYYEDTTAGTPTLTASSTGLTSATTQFTLNQSGPVNQTVTGNLIVDGNATINNTLSTSTLGANSGELMLASIMGWNTAGQAPVAGSNTGMILDCWSPSHGDGLGFQSGGIYLK